MPPPPAAEIMANAFVFWFGASFVLQKKAVAPREAWLAVLALSSSIVQYFLAAHVPVLPVTPDQHATKIRAFVQLRFVLMVSAWFLFPRVKHDVWWPWVVLLVLFAIYDYVLVSDTLDAYSALGVSYYAYGAMALWISLLIIYAFERTDYEAVPRTDIST